ncbi:uncharacterized protein TRIADDRAFT_11427, partial [Trichoplax adhaerens]
MIYAIDKFINNNPYLLPGIKIGWKIIDSCENRTVALQNVASNLILSERRNFPQLRCNLDPYTNSSPIVGLIGAKNEDITISTAALTSSLKIPQISYFSFDKLLNNRKVFSYFYRTSISSTTQIKNIFDIINYFKWNWISFVLTDKSTFEMIQSSKSEAQNKHLICYEEIYRLGNNATLEAIANVVSKLKYQSRAQAIVLLGKETTIYSFLLEAQAQNLTGKTFIGSYTWLTSRKIQQIDYRIIGGAIGIAFNSQSIKGFDEYLHQLNFCNNLGNPWFMKLWRKKLTELGLDVDKTVANCTLNGEWKRSLGNSFYSPSFKAVFVMDAVLAYGHALHSLLGCNYTHCSLTQTSSLDRELFNDILGRVHFASKSSYAFTFRSDGNTDSLLDIVNLQRILVKGHSRIRAVVIGSWDRKSGLLISDNKIIWNGNKPWTQIPVSRCSADCLPGYHMYQGLEIHQSQLSCCWTCKKCQGHSITNKMNSLYCTQCPNLTNPNHNNTQCVPLPLVQARYGRPMKIIYFIIVTIYFVLLIVIWTVIIVKRNTPIVKGSNFKLTSLLLFFHAIGVPASFLFLAQPTIAICYTRIFMITTFVIGVYATILCKTNQVSTIFHNPVNKRAKLAHLTKNRSQFTFIFTIILVVNGILLCLVISKPINIKMQRTYDNQVEILCHVDNFYFDINLLTWMAVLGLLSLYFAFKARSLPDNFNESKHIYLSSLLIVVLGICCFPITFIVSGSMADSVRGITTLIIGSSPLLCLFLPKLYIIFYKSELNTRQQIM